MKTAIAWLRRHVTVYVTATMWALPFAAGIDSYNRQVTVVVLCIAFEVTWR